MLKLLTVEAAESEVVESVVEAVIVVDVVESVVEAFDCWL